MTWKNSPLSHLHVELSTHCNAACPFCPRFYNTTKVIDPSLKLTSISLENFKKYFPNNILNQLTRILYCGNKGDPLMAKDVYEIVEHVASVNKNCIQIIHTNGGMRDPKFWKKFGQLSSSNAIEVVFSIDGLKDTNHIYRRNVNWEKLIGNVTEFINAGGKAVWDYLVFLHNEHEIDEAKNLAYQIGFKNFRIKGALGFEDTWGPGVRTRFIFDETGNVITTLSPPNNLEYRNNNYGPLSDCQDTFNSAELNLVKELKFFPNVKQKTSNFNNNQSDDLGALETLYDNKKIKCLMHTEFGSEIFVSAEGILFPCCFVGVSYTSSNANFIDNQIRSNIENHYDSLDLNKKNIEEVLSSEILDDIFTKSWDIEKISLGKMALCSATCGHNNWKDRLYL